MHTPEEPIDVDGGVNRREVIAGLGLISAGAGITKYRNGSIESYDEVSIDNIGGSEDQILKYSFEGSEYFVELGDLKQDPAFGDFADLVRYSGSYGSEGFEETKTVSGGDKIDNSMLTPPEIMVENVEYKGDGRGKVDLRVRSELSPEVLEPSQR